MRSENHRLWLRRQAAVAAAGVVAAGVLVLGAVSLADASGPDGAASATGDTPIADVTGPPQFAPVASPGPTPVPSPVPPPAPPPAQDPSAAPTPVPSEPGPTAAPSPPPPGLPHVRPVRVEVPDVGIASDLVDLHLNPDGSLQAPEDYDLAGWYADGPAPGDATSPPAVVVGHVDSTTGPAVFYRLRELVEGDRIEITRQDGSVAVFRVRTTVQYPKSNLPADEVYRARDPSELVLITCSGEFDREARSYLDNFVVTARLDVEASTADA